MSIFTMDLHMVLCPHIIAMDMLWLHVCTYYHSHGYGYGSMSAYFSLYMDLMAPCPHIIAHMDLDMAPCLHIILLMDMDMTPCPTF